MNCLFKTEVALATLLKSCYMVLQTFIIFRKILDLFLNYLWLTDGILEKHFIKAKKRVNYTVDT